MRTESERIIHTVLFEVLAISIVTPAVRGALGATLANAGTLSVLISAGATVANYVWTALFDRIVPTRRRGFWLRAVQAAGLELLITLYTVPLVLVFTEASLGAALLFDVSAIGFFILFGMAYNTAFDAVVIRLARAG